MTRPENTHSLPSSQEDVKLLIRKWGIDVDPDMLVLALTHRSFAHEMGELPDNERLEFLGDAVLQVIVTERLYRDYPHSSEGDLAKMRSATVSQPALAIVGRKLELGRYILLGNGEEKTGGRNKDSLLCDTVEALIGATYLCHGLEPTRRVVEHALKDLLRKAPTRAQSVDWKTTLQELAADLHMSPLTYSVEGTGPDHARKFTAHVSIDGTLWGTGEGTSKKNAEREAAHQAVVNIKKKEKSLLSTKVGIVAKNESEKNDDSKSS